MNRRQVHAILLGTALGGLVSASTGCVDAPPAPTGSLSGSVASASAQPASAAQATSLSLSPQTVDINAPYSFGGGQSQTNAGLSEQPAAGFLTSAQLGVSFLDATHQAAAPTDVVWTTSNPALVTVDGTGLIRSVDPGTSGTVVITVSLKKNPQVSATASVTLHDDGKLALELQ